MFSNRYKQWKKCKSFIMVIKSFMHHDHSGVCNLLQSCLTLCDPVDCSLPGSSVHGTFQARILEWVAVPSLRRFSWPRDRTQISCISCTGRWVFYHFTTGQPLPGGASGIKSPRQCRRQGLDPWVEKIPWRGKWLPTPVFLPGKFHGQRSLVGYSPSCHKELDMI